MGTCDLFKVMLHVLGVFGALDLNQYNNICNMPSLTMRDNVPTITTVVKQGVNAHGPLRLIFDIKQ